MPVVFKAGPLPSMPVLIHHVHLTPQAERMRGQASAILAKASGAKERLARK